jgi:hypothetical protein
LYIKHCSACELNQTKRHLIYEELVLIFIEKISFKIIVMDFILALSGDMDAALTVICKISKRVTIISGKSSWNASQWAEALLNRLMIADWGIPEGIISDRNLKFIFEF